VQVSCTYIELLVTATRETLTSKITLVCMPTGLRSLVTLDFLRALHFFDAGVFWQTM